MNIPLTCPECLGRGTFAVEMNDGTQYRTCLACKGTGRLKVITVVVEAVEDDRCFVPLACPEIGTSQDYKLGVRDSIGGRPW